ncbi:cupin domain-containing protein [Jannaschia rubra]|uniref:cupin domain-containing protein n=1 Tax=Jannaschia rubra TaxID=282197 RepID=UPI002493AF5A|nr:cupin domain-containing protein [Jannaschia rubra]
MNHVIDFSGPPAQTRERRLRDLPDRVISGDPEHVTQVFHDNDGLTAGTWTSTPGKWRAFEGREEFCVILAGHCRLIADNGTARDFHAGDSFLIPDGFRGYWEVVETTTKHFVIRSRP